MQQKRGETQRTLREDLKAMQPEPTLSSPDADSAALACPGCRATMLRGMRFCRFCGYRLGEGVEEYAETIRLPGSARPQARATAEAGPQATTTGLPNAWGAMRPASVETSALNRLRGARSCGRMGRMGWPLVVVMSVAIAAAAGATPFFRFKVDDGRPVVVRRAPRSYFGVNNFSDFRGEDFEGALIDYVTPPGSPADRAGLVGGDVITFFGGETVAGNEDIVRLLRETPTGQAVEVEFVRDGQTRRTTLTTATRDEIQRLEKAFAARPEGKGFFGIDDTDDLERVLAPGLNVYGVRLKGILKNRPAYIAGLRDGDILVEFGGVPVRTAREFGARIKRAVPDTTITVVVVRGGGRLEIPLKVGSLN